MKSSRICSAQVLACASLFTNLNAAHPDVATVFIAAAVALLAVVMLFNEENHQ